MTGRLTRIVCVVLAAASLSACAPPLLVAGAAAGIAGASIVSDQRDSDVMLEDKQIEIRIVEAINDDDRISDATVVSVSSYNRVVLLTGQATSEEDRERVIDHARAIDEARSIHDHVEIRDPVGLRQRSRDTLTTARVKSELIGERGLASTQVKVTTDNDVVYLMGLVTRDEADRIVPVVQQVDGIRGIVLVFEYVD